MEEKFGKNTEGDVELDAVTEDNAPTELEDAEMEELSENKLKKLKEKLRQSEKDKMEALEDLQRARADFLNARKRLDEERVKDRERSIIDHLDRLLPLCDSFQMALADQAFAEAPDNLQKGLRGIESQLSSILKSYNVTPIGEVGETFDPREHEALTEVAVEDEKADHKIVTVIQKGYKMNDLVVRPARVTVGIFKN